MTSARTNWSGTITTIRSSVKLSASVEGGVVDHRAGTRASVQSPSSSGRRARRPAPSATRRRGRGRRRWGGSASRADPPTARLRRRASPRVRPSSSARRSRPHVVLCDLARRLPARRIGRPAGGARLVHDLVLQLALLVEDGLDVLAVAHDPRERVAVDLVEVAALGAEPDREQRLDGVLRLLLLARRPPRPQPGRDLLREPPADDREEPDSERICACAPSVEQVADQRLGAAAFGAFFGIASPTSTGMYAGPSGPVGTGNATKSSGRWSSAVFSRAT